MKTWQSYVLWIPIAAILELVAVGLSSGPPLSGLSLLVAHVGLTLIVIVGPFALPSYGQQLIAEPILGFALLAAIGAITILILNRNRRLYYNLVAGVLWLSAGAVALYFEVSFSI